MKKSLLLTGLSMVSMGLFAQNVGIGTATPSEKLHIVGNTRITDLGGVGDAIVFTNNNGVLDKRALSGNATDILDGTGTFVPFSSLSNNWTLTGNAGTTPGTNFIGTTDAQDFQVRTNGALRLTFEDNGAITIPNNAASRIVSGVAGGARLLGEQGNTPARPAIGFFSTNGVDDGAGGNGIYRPLANTMAFATGSTERMRITAGGALGLGTAAPSERLHLVGNARITDLGGVGDAIVFTNNNGVLDKRALSGNATDILDGTGTFVPFNSLSNNWTLTGNAGTTPGTNFIGTTDAQDFQVRTNGALRLTFEDNGPITIPNNAASRIVSGVAGGARLLGEQGNTPARPAIGFFSTNGVDDGAGGNGIYRPLANTMAFATGSTERMRITAGGSVGIGNAAPAERLVVYRDQNVSAEIGRAHVGHVGHNDWAGFSHIDRNATGDYALLQNSLGRTLLNASAGQVMGFRQNNADQFEMEADGDLAMLNGNSFKQPNNVRYTKRTNVQSHNNNDAYWTITNNTVNIDVEPGNIIKMEANLLTRLTGGSGNDDYTLKVFSTGACAAGDHNLIDGYRPNETGNDHDNFKQLSYLDYYVVPACTGTMSFRLEIRNTGDDAYEVKDAVLFITKY